MAIRRACSYKATIKTPLAPSEYSAIRVTFSQNDAAVLSKNLGDSGLTISGDYVIVQLSQSETLQFSAVNNSRQPAYALLQIRCYRSTYDAPGSRIWALPVYRSLNEEVLS